jgi:hypothetical protein
MKYRFIILFWLISAIVICPLLSKAQRGSRSVVFRKNIEFGVTASLTQYNGDLALSDGVHPDYIGGGIVFRYNFNPRITFRTNVFYGYIDGSDWDDQPHINGHPWNRNLSFKSHILDISPQLEINILKFVSNGQGKRNWSPYVFGGIALYNFDPKAYYQGHWYELQPLGTEGQGTRFGTAKYQLTQFSIPYGIGIKYAFRRPRNYRYGRKMIDLEYWNVGIEVTQHHTFTDHLDDVGGFYPSSFDDVFKNNTIAKALCDRSGERNNGINTRYIPGAKDVPRGLPDNDTYMWYGITITKTFNLSGNMDFY